MRLALFLAFLLVAPLAWAQPPETNTAESPAPPKPSPAKSSRAATIAQMQSNIDKLTQSNHDLLDLLKKQQAVLEDIQFDRRLQSRQIQSLDERLAEALIQNTQLQNKVANLEMAATIHPYTPVVAPPAATANTESTNTATPPPPVVEQPPPPPATYLPPPDSEGMPGTKSWHRLFTLKGEDGKQSDLFHIEGRTWRVLWHNQDPPGKALQGTSGLFINAFPRDDTIPQRVCAKVGTGGDSTELQGPGNYYLKIEASGGSWELAVEDFR